MITTEFQWKVGGVLADADSVTLSDPGATYGIKRMDNSDIIAAAGTAMTHVSLGVYRHTFAPPLPGLTYSRWVKAIYQGVPYYFELEFTDSSSAAWYYSNRAGVLTLMDPDTLRIVLDLNDDGNEDEGLLVDDGTAADAYMDLFLSAEGATVPVVISDQPGYIGKALADVNNHLTIWYAWHHRGLQELSSKLNRSTDDIAGLMSGYKKYADDQLKKIAGILTATDDNPDNDEGGLTSIPLTSARCNVCDENGCAI